MTAAGDPGIYEKVTLKLGRHRGGERWAEERAPGDVLAPGIRRDEGITGGGHALVGARAAGAGVAERAGVELPLTVLARAIREEGVDRQRLPRGGGDRAR